MLSLIELFLVRAIIVDKNFLTNVLPAPIAVSRVISTVIAANICNIYIQNIKDQNQKFQPYNTAKPQVDQLNA